MKELQNSVADMLLNLRFKCSYPRNLKQKFKKIISLYLTDQTVPAKVRSD